MKENIYGHFKRLQWIKSHISKDDVIVEFGCGTGYMISLPLAKMGYSILGVELDEKSVTFGQTLFLQEGFDTGNLKAIDINELKIVPDVIIASEVLEHIPNESLNSVLKIIHNKLKPNGIFLVTVPNGYGWFECESFLWFKVGVGFFLERLRIVGVINRLKSLIFGQNLESEHPSTLADSPHVQRFTHRSISTLLKDHGYEIIDMCGSVLFCGPFSNLFFTGIRPIMRLNCILGNWFPRIASGFYIACRRSTSS